MAAPSGQVSAVDFASWLESRLEELGMDPDVYPAYIQGVLREEEESEERDEALRGILAAFLEEDSLEEVRLEIVTKWIDFQNSIPRESAPKDEVQALTSMIEKQAQIVVKTRDMSEEEQQRKATLLAQYANVTDEEDEDEEDEMIGASAINPDKSLFKNTNLEDVMNARKLERDSMRDAGQKKKEQDKQQRENQKASKQERKDKEKKRTQKGERKR
ncbi:MGC81882 protein [Xenopus laevis]|uniref:Coiled-coil domain-containing protein 43 n=1 Tax=Xenopus laevis TaxID=8355 RepID=Q6DJP5_XENLA|nr:uncharacterized protein LOC444767 [Xenopus laevis]AAH75130.1 MGC81882 protein [Xenopus laevis]